MTRSIPALLLLAAIACGEKPEPMYGDGGASDSDTDGDFDCAAVPTPPFSFNTITNVVSGEDFVFDDEGNLIGMEGGSLFKSTKTGGSTLWVAGAGCVSGLRALPSGDVVCNGSDTLVHIDGETGAATTVATSLAYPNGIEVDLRGYAYVSEQNSGEVTKIDPVTGETWTIATGLNAPNGLTFSPDYRTLYVGSFCGGNIYKIEFDAAGQPGPASVFISASDPDGVAGGMTGCFDGMGVDCCGNVYVCDYGIIRVYRISPDGGTIEIAADLSSASSWIPNMQWGSGLGGWDEMNLYVIDISSAVYEIPVGVPSKYREYP
ncbi:MAG: SMP-30/gluconolactonase/LRE family protein [Proteobacteria bacterium]|jgi:sugar lactone lactonase YvrE|nr:SMP-30/gluconolactonase/LRE family protein [Pseudomonadota bacterium]